MSLPERRKIEWLAEHRILSRDKWRIERRLTELEDMLDTFFPGARPDAPPIRATCHHTTRISKTDGSDVHCLNCGQRLSA